MGFQTNWGGRICVKQAKCGILPVSRSETVHSLGTLQIRRGFRAVNRGPDWLWLETQETSQDVRGFPAETPKCHIVPVSCAYGGEGSLENPNLLKKEFGLFLLGEEYLEFSLCLIAQHFQHLEVLKAISALQSQRLEHLRCTETITDENLEICFRFRFRDGKARKISPDFLSHLLSQWSCWAPASHSSRPHLQNNFNSPNDFLSLSLLSSNK